MKEFARLAVLFRLEVRLHFGHWRFWFSFLLFGGLTAWLVLANGRGAETAIDLAPAARPMLWAVAGMVLLMGAETAAECRRPGLAPILWTKPFSSLTFVVARQAALFTVLAALTAMPFVAQWAVARFVWKSNAAFEPAFWLIVYWAWPAALLLSSVGAWTRTVFDHDVSALGVAAALAWAAAALDSRAGLGLSGFDASLIAPLVAAYHPSIGRDLFHPPFLWGVARTAVLASLFVALSACHLRRIEPRPLRLTGLGVFALPTFRRMADRLRIDPSPGAGVALALVLTGSLAAGVCGWQAAEHRAREARLQQWARAMREDLPQRVGEGAALKLAHVKADIRVPDRERIEVDATIEAFNSRSDPMPVAVFALSPTLGLQSVEFGKGGAVETQRFGDFVAIRPSAPIAPQTTETLRFRYSGTLVDLRVGQRDPITGRYAASMEPVRFGARFASIRSETVLPVPIAFASVEDQIVARRAPGAATYDLRLSMYGGLRTFSPEADAEIRDRIVTTWPTPGVEILAGPYERFDEVYGGLPVRIHCFPKDREMIEAAFLLCSSQFERLMKVFGPPPGGRLSFVEDVEPAQESIPMRTIFAEMASDLRFHAQGFGEGTDEGYDAFRRWVSIMWRRAMGTYFASRLRFVSSLSPMRRGLYEMLWEDLETDNIRTTSLRSPDLFDPRIVLNRALIEHSELRLFQSPFVAEKSDADEADTMGSAADRVRIATLIWRMLRYVMGDEKFCGLIQDLTARTDPISPEEFEAAAEARQGEKLDWFFNHWFRGYGIPRYEILEADAHMVENEERHEIDYAVRTVVTNRGQGLMPTPVWIQSERDTVIRKLWLDSGTTGTIEMTMPYRPEFVAVDPEGWIAQEAEWQADRRMRGRPIRKVEILDQ